MSSPVSTPSAQSVDPEGIRRLLAALDDHPGIDPHGIIVHRHGHRIAEGYWAPHRAADTPLVYSLSKSFTSAALGLAIEEGRIGLDETIADLLPEETRDAAPLTRTIRVRHLASMSSGYDHELLLEILATHPIDPVHGLFTRAPEHPPGSWFAYNQPPLYALAVGLQRRIGENLTDYLGPRVMEPLGLPALRSQRWVGGYDLGFSGIHTTLDAIAELAQTHLDGGLRDGRSLLPAHWIGEATRVQVPSPREPNPDWRCGYGFGFWGARHGYRGDGAFGQFLIVLPEQDAIVAIFSETLDLQAVLDLVWEHLLPAIDRATRSADDAGLAERMAELATPTAAQRTGGTASVPHGDLVRAGGRAQPRLERLALRGDEVVLSEAGDDVSLPLGRSGWAVSDAHPLAVSSAADGDDVAIDIASLDTPHTLRIAASPKDGTFSADWVTEPIGPPRTGDTLATLRAPD